jgi:hypothetical protein
MAQAGGLSNKVANQRIEKPLLLVASLDSRRQTTYCLFSNEQILLPLLRRVKPYFPTPLVVCGMFLPVICSKQAKEPSFRECLVGCL